MTLTPSPAVDRAVARLRSLKTKHHVRRLARGVYEITSGRSGQAYRVDLAAMSCTCAAGQQGRVCDHKVAALSVSQGMAATIGRPAPVAIARTIRGGSIPAEAIITRRGEVILHGFTI